MTTDKKIPILVIAGPTASGKSALACALAGRLNGEIISADSMQVYRGMDIGTAKPSADVRARIKHHLVDILDISQSFSVHNFKALAKQCAADICSRGKVPILAGGTGLYIDMLIKDVILPEIRTNPQLRAQLSSLAQQKGNEYLHRLLASFDPQAAAAIHPNNVKRVVRAIEIYRMTQVTMSEWNRRSQQKESDFDAFKVYLDFERDVLYERINARVDEFMSQGLVEEARELYAAGLADAPTASQAIGYKELLPYLSGQCTLEEATDQIKQNTRNYAKRQETYFARMDMDMRLDAGEPVDEQTIETIAAAFESPRC